MNEQVMEKKDTSWMLLIYQFAIYTSMMSGYKGIAYYIAVAFVGLFFIKIFVKHSGKLPVDISVKSFVLFLLFYWASATVNFRSSNFYTYFAYYIITFFPLLIKEYLKVDSTTNMIIKSLKCFMFVLVVFSGISIGYYLVNPGLARDMAAHLTDGSMAIGGGYSLAYAAAVICVYLFSKMLNKRIKVKTSYIFICIMCWYLVYLTESAMTFLAMIIGIFISIITKGSEITKGSGNELLKFFFIGIFAFAFSFILVYNKYAVAEWIMDFVEGKDHNIVYSRIEEIVNKFVYGKTNYHVDKRDNTLERSWEIFKEYPLFGMGYKYGYVFELGKYYGMGNHSEVLDSFARYGLIGGILWLTPYFMTIKQIIRTNFGCAMTILIMMFFNPFLSFHSNAVMFMFIPLFEEVLKRREENRIHQ